MRKLLLAPLALCAVVLIPVLYLPKVSARTLMSEQSIEWKEWDDPDPDPRLDDVHTYWMGRVDFSGILGTAYFAEDPTGTPTFPGKIFHFYELFYIAFDDGGWIQGHDNGVYVLLSPGSNWIYMANGWVTSASESYADLIGCHYFERGTTTYPLIDPIVGSIEGTGFCFLG